MNDRKVSGRRLELAQRLLGLIRSEGLAKDTHLIEQQLAERFGVSRTPVRAALKVLESHGAVRAVPNLGFFVDREPDELYAMDLSGPISRDDEVYVRIVDDRLAGRLPETVTQTEIVRRYDVSQAQIRRVLEQMADEGLITRSPGHGWTFEKTLDSWQAQTASYEFRRVLEPAAILLESFRPDGEVLDRLRRENEALLEDETLGRSSRARRFLVDANFHEAIARLTHNPMFVQAIQHQNHMRRILEYRGYTNAQRIADWCREHLAILKALEAGNLRRASRLMRDHLDNARANAETVRGTGDDRSSSGRS